MVAVDGVPAEQLNPYIYFDREVQAYKRLEAAMEGQVPETKLAFSITPEQEHELLGSYMKSYQPSRCRRKVGTSAKKLPLKAILMEYVEGPRLTREALLSSQSLRSELLEAVSKMHACGVLWGDIKWRNLVVRGRSSPSESAGLSSVEERLEEGAEGQRALVILDFSNARFLRLNDSTDAKTTVESNILSAEEWEYKRQQELKIVHNMVQHGRLTDHQDGFLQNNP